MAKKQEINKKVVYVVGTEYDDFCDVGFSISGICEKREEVNNLIEKVLKEYPSIKRRDVVIRIYELNRFYADYEDDEIDRL